jgi:RNA polymerase sporulation-specific sigma factor
MTKTNEELLLLRHEPTIRDQIIRQNANLVRSIANKFNPDDEDVYSEGMIGLIKAIEKFDESKKIKFSTFAYKYISGTILDYYNRIETKIPDAISLNEPTDDSGLYELIDLLESSEDNIERYEEYDLHKDRRRFVDLVINKECSDQDRAVFTMYLDGKTRKDITIKFGISRERVRQIEGKVKKILEFYVKNVY